MKKTLRKITCRIPFARRVYRIICKNHRNSTKPSSSQLYEQTIVRQGSKECFEKVPLFVHWMVTHKCNYRCPYCFQAATGYPDDACSLEQASKAIQYIAAANRPSYQITLLGGEPTVYPHLDQIIALLDEKLGTRIEVLRILTNGSLLPNHIDMLLKAAKRTRVIVTVSVHFEFANIGELIDFVKRYSKEINLEMLLMFHPGFFPKVQKMAEELINLRSEYPFEMSIDLLREPPSFKHHLSTYTEEHMAWEINATERFRETVRSSSQRGYEKKEETGWSFYVERKKDGGIEEKANMDVRQLGIETGFKFRGLNCIVGANVIEIRPNGDVKGAVCGLAPVVCNIFEDNPFDKDEWMYAISCTKDKCGCNIDYRIPKFLSSDEAQEYVDACRNLQKKLLRLD